MAEALRLGLVGSPNAGKTTLFNALTGLRARVGNYPGVTVERREGELVLGGRRAVIIDLPGTYSLDPISADEAVVTRVIDGEIDDVEMPHALVIVADACSLERSLLLIAQVLARRRPTCLVLSMIDELRSRGGSLDRERLEAALGIPLALRTPSTRRVRRWKKGSCRVVVSLCCVRSIRWTKFGAACEVTRKSVWTSSVARSKHRCA